MANDYSTVVFFYFQLQGIFGSSSRFLLTYLWHVYLQWYCVWAVSAFTWMSHTTGKWFGNSRSKWGSRSVSIMPVQVWHCQVDPGDFLSTIGRYFVFERTGVGSLPGFTWQCQTYPTCTLIELSKIFRIKHTKYKREATSHWWDRPAFVWNPCITSRPLILTSTQLTFDLWPCPF